MDLNDRIRGERSCIGEGDRLGSFADLFAFNILKVLEGTAGLSNEPEQ